MAGEKLVHLMQTAARGTLEATETTDLVYVEVLSTAPIRVRVNERVELGEAHLILSGQCRDVLATGDRAIALRVHGGQKYYLMEKAE